MREAVGGGGRFFVVQARPVTGMRSQAGVLEEWNDSLAGDYLWTSGNLGEALPDVMTPCTWSLLRILMAEAIAVSSLDGHALSGNIGGRFYMNLSLMGTTASAFGIKGRLANAIGQVFGRLPPDLDIPLLPVSRRRVLGTCCRSPSGCGAAWRAT